MKRSAIVPILAFVAVVDAASARAQTAVDTCGITDFAPGTKLTADDVGARWNSEAQALAPFGADASFDLATREYHATFGAPASLAAPASVSAIRASGSGFFLDDADVDGVGRGRVVIGGAALTANGTLVAGGAGGATGCNVYAVDAVEDAVSLVVDLASIDLSGAVVSGYASATFVDASTGASTVLGASFHVTSAGALSGADTAQGAVTTSSLPLSLTCGDFALAGDFAADAAASFDGADVTPVRSIVGTSGTLTLSAGEVAGAARATQVFDDAGPKIGAEIEVVALSPLVAVASSGGSANVPMMVRNKSGKAIAILSEIDVDGCATEAVTPVVDDVLPLFIDGLVAAIQNSGWAAPFVAVAVAPILGVAIVAEAFVDIAGAFVDAVGDIFCGLFGCDDNASAPPAPVPPVPFPKWLEPGQVAYFEVALLPNVGDGDYPVRVRFIGQNYAEVHADFTMRVGAGVVPPEWTCDVGVYGAGDGCDCGCGAIDTECGADGACTVDHCAERGGTLANDDVTCTFPQPTPPPTDPGIGDGGDGSDGDHVRFSCANVPAVEASMWAGLAVLATLLRRARSETRRRKARLT